MTEPTKTPAGGQAPKSEPQTAVAPLNAIAPEDLQASANECDAWLRKKTDNYITLDRLTAVAGSLPVLDNNGRDGDLRLRPTWPANREAQREAESARR
ncbi:hypothetical protein OOT46_29145 [Aquabacterium sp. A7-Y]|uniref:hypothetical protein n=1 Tax=Aquabacterium sp. A7-Y TaxID=1349605 RepID=UPI00223E0B24|nr:hypothetical protein [Aquabacterium sp. A7-Y]MCW7541868.1 hypothetical protein [Aquabacterium sp. A7-Y]